VWHPNTPRLDRECHRPNGRAFVWHCGEIRFWSGRDFRLLARRACTSCSAALISLRSPLVERHIERRLVSEWHWKQRQACGASAAFFLPCSDEPVQLIPAAFAWRGDGQSSAALPVTGQHWRHLFGECCGIEYWLTSPPPARVPHRTVAASHLDGGQLWYERGLPVRVSPSCCNLFVARLAVSAPTYSEGFRDAHAWRLLAERFSR